MVRGISLINMFVIVLNISLLTEANIFLRTGKTQVVLSPLAGWTPVEISWDGYAVTENTGSGQGTIIVIDGSADIWTGSVHGNEMVLETKLYVDGFYHEVVDSKLYQAQQELKFYRRTLLNDVYILTSVLVISDNQITEDVTLQGISPSKKVKLAYGFAASRSNRLSNYYGYELSGDLLIAGKSNLNDNSVFKLMHSASICQYDPIFNVAVLSTIINTDVVLEQFIWDRSFDNKLYARFEEIEGSCAFEKRHALQQRIVFFYSSPEDIHNNVQDKLRKLTCPVEISGDINRDCKVDMYDFSLLASSWLDCGWIERE